MGSAGVPNRSEGVVLQRLSAATSASPRNIGTRNLDVFLNTLGEAAADKRDPLQFPTDGPCCSVLRQPARQMQRARRSGSPATCVESSYGLRLCRGCYQNVSSGGHSPSPVSAIHCKLFAIHRNFQNTCCTKKGACGGRRSVVNSEKTGRVRVSTCQSSLSMRTIAKFQNFGERNLVAFPNPPVLGGSPRSLGVKLASIWGKPCRAPLCSTPTLGQQVGSESSSSSAAKLVFWTTSAVRGIPPQTGWMDGKMHGWLAGWLDGWMDGCIDEYRSMSV